MYAAQCLERGIGVFLVLPMSPGGPTDVDQFDAMLDDNHKRTLGRLLNKLRKWRELPAEQEALMERALTMRNWLAHRFFRDRAGQFMTSSGRAAMIEELGEAWRLFDSAHSYIRHVTAVWMKEHGITQDALAEIERQMIADAAENHD